MKGEMAELNKMGEGKKKGILGGIFSLFCM
jgi:hypothetical protein